MLQRAEPAVSGFSVARARHIIADLFTPRPWIYWTDFLTSTAIGNVGLMVCLTAVRDWPRFLPGQALVVRLLVLLAAFVVTSLLFYRMTMFIHEMVHFRSGAMRSFRIVWNLLCGIPFLMPSFVYYTHMDHHRRRHYGTEHDGEYLPFGHESPWAMVWHVLASLAIPPLVVLRFLVIGPVSWFVPPLRRWVLQHGSSMIIDYKYVRPLPEKQEARIIFLQECLCFAYLLALAIVPPVFMGRLAWPLAIVAYALGVTILTLNAIRTLGAHRYTGDGHTDMSFTEQLQDSTNIHARAWITELWGPVGTRYHALHHLFPALPYHAMPEAHRRLIAQLPTNSPYHDTVEPSLTAAILKLWRLSAQAKASANPPARESLKLAS